jgi:hypothetical protein
LPHSFRTLLQTSEIESAMMKIDDDEHKQSWIWEEVWDHIDMFGTSPEH